MQNVIRNMFGAAWLVVVALVAAGCSGSVTPPKPATIASFAASAEKVAVGESATLSWVVEGDVASTELLSGGLVVSSTGVAGPGSFEIARVSEGRSTYVLVVTGQDGQVARAEASVTGVSRPTVVRFTASREAAPSGSAVSLAWKTLLADQVELRAGSEVIATRTGAEALDGAFTVRPTQTTTFTLKASGLAGTAEATVRVVVNQAPISAVSVTPSTVRRGESVTVHWTTEGATSVVVKEQARTLFTAPFESIADGSFVFTPERSTTLAVVATGAGGEVTEALPVTVRLPTRIESFAALPSEVVVGGHTTLAWTVADATSVALTANGAPVELSEAGVPTGSIELAPTENTLYVLTASGPDEQATAELFVPVHGAPVVGSFEATPLTIYRRRAPAVLSWTTGGANAVSITEAGGDVVDLGSAPASAGSVAVSPQNDASYVLKAYGPGGTAQSAPIAITVLEPAPLIELSLLRSPITVGQVSELSWRVLDQTSFTLEKSEDGTTFTALPVEQKGADDALNVSPSESTTYRLRATGPGGTSEKSIQLVVVKPPKVTSFSSDARIGTTANSLLVTDGVPFRVSWQTEYADAVLLDPPTEYESDAPAFESIEALEGTVEFTHTSGSNLSGFADVPFPFGFRFPFYGVEYGSVRVTNNGYLCFGGNADCGTSGTSSYADIPSSGTPNNFIAPFWGFLEKVANRSKLLYRLEGVAPDRKFIVEWAHYDNGTSSESGEELNFQVVMFESGLWEIRNAPRVPGTKNPGKDSRWGVIQTIGVEAPSGRLGMKVSYKSTSGLCRPESFRPGSGTTPGFCDPLTRIRPKLAPANGSKNVTLTNVPSAVLSLRALGPLGATKSPELAVTVVPKPVITTFTASRTHVGSGEDVVLTFKAGLEVNLEAVEISDGSGLVPGVIGVDNSVTVKPARTTTYTLIARNKAGYEERKAITVTVAAPTLSGAKVTPDFGAMKDPYAFTWTADSGLTTLRLVDPDGVEVLSLPRIDATVVARSVSTSALTKPGTYQLVAQNASGATAAPLQIDIATDLRILSFGSDVVEQTTGRDVTLSWEAYNGSELAIHDGTRDVFTSALAAVIRKGTVKVQMGASDTTYTLRVKNAATPSPVQRQVTVRAAPAPRIDQFVTEPANPVWGQPFDLVWSTTNAVKVKLVRLYNGAPIEEYPAARDQQSGRLSLTLERNTTFRLLVQNVVGEEVSADRAVTLTTGPATLSFDVTPGIAPRGGYAQLRWDATQVDGVDLWKRSADTEPLQLPYDYKPNGFIDISASGEKLNLKLTTDAENIRYGFQTVAFPPDFRPPYFGTPMAGMLVSASGIVTLSPNPNDLRANGCASTTTTGTGGCASSTSSANVALPNAYLAPFWSDLGACKATATESGCGTSQRSAGVGKAYWKLVGTAPNRVAVVQWTNWDFASTSSGYGAANSGDSLTFEVKIHENGDTEYQYKVLKKQSPQYAGGGYSTVALESPDGKQFFSLNVSGNTPVLQPGDGWRFFTGRQPRTGNTRSFYKIESSTTQVQFRATVAGATSPSSLKTLDLKAGVNDLVLSELMIDPSDTNDTGKEWIEIRNTRTTAADLTGYTLETSSGSYTFQQSDGAIVPARTTGGGDGLLVVGQSRDLAQNGGVLVDVAYGTGLQLHDVADTVVLRYGDVLVDRVEYDRTAGWRVPRGRSLSLDGNAGGTLNESALMWCGGYSPNDPNAIATPKAPNGPCWSFTQQPVDPSTRLEALGDTSMRQITSISSAKTGYPIGFEFPYFGERYSTLNFTAYGFASFGPLAGTSSSSWSLNSSLPVESFGGTDGVYPLWDNMGFQTGGAVYAATLGTAPNRRFVIHWAKMKFGTTTDPADYSLVLTEQGGIEFHYHELGGSNGDGRGATVGLEAFGDQWPLQVGYGNGSASATGFLPGSPFMYRLERRP